MGIAGRFAVLMAVLPALCFAQAEQEPLPEPATQLDSVEVTGSRIKRTDYETAQPVFALSRTDIERSGFTSLGDLLQHLSIAGSASNTSVVNNDVGTIEVDLRNLGAQRTLVLVDGRRWVGGMYYYATGSVDLSTIPLSIVERVEVLKDGASAIYGSDAIAGVVNIITRKGYVGTELRAQVGAYSQGDGVTQDYDLSWGGMLGGTSLFVDLGYGRESGVLNGDRDLTKFYRAGVGSTRGTEFTPRGTLSFTPTQSNGAALGQDLCPTDPTTGMQFCHMILRRGETITGDPSENTQSVASRYQPFNSTSLDPDVNDLYDPNAIGYLSFPNNRVSLFGRLSHSFGEVSLQGEFLYARRRLKQQFPFSIEFGDQADDRFNTIYLAADNPYNPFGQDIGRDDGSGAGSGIVLRALSEAMPAVLNSLVETYRLGFGLDGRFEWLDRPFSWQSGAVYAASRNHPAHPDVNLDHLRLALGPAADCAAVSDCVPLNILGGPGSITPEMLQYFTYPGYYDKHQWLTDVYLTMSNDLFALPAGMLKTAYGLEYRKESYSDQPDPLIVSCISLSCFAPTSGSFDAKEAFAELDVPLLKNLTLARQVDLSAAARYSKYNTYGSNTTYKLGLRWKPVDSLLLRATKSTAFRAPAVSDLFLTPAQLVYTGLADPCSDYDGSNGGAAASPTVQQNCRDSGVPASYVQPSTTTVHDGGNPMLHAESADTYTAGAVFSPTLLRDLNFYVDWYRIHLKDAITQLDPQFTLDSCYQTQGGSQTCSLITRDPSTGNITDLRFQPINIGANHVEGIDFSTDYVLPWQGVGRFKLTFDSSYLIENAVLIADATGQLQKDGRQGTETPTNAFPRLKASSGLQWSLGGWKASWRMRYVHHMTEACDDGIMPTLTEIGVCSRPNLSDPARSENVLRSVLYHDVQVGYSIPQWRTELVAGARNLFNQSPPASYTNLYNAFDASTYDLPGVFPYLRLKVSF